MYCGEETDGELASGVEMQPLRFSDCSIAGTAEEITSDIILPETRIPSTPEIGSESNSGDVSTEWNIDEQDNLFEGVFCGDWEDIQGETGKKRLAFGDTVHSYSMLKKYSQTPQAWQLFTKEFVNQLTMDFSTDSFVKLTWNFMGSNNPLKVFSDPLEDLEPVYKDALKTKSFITNKGFIKLGDDVDSLVAIRQCPSMNITINNNLERTPALCETESIENSLGNFDVSGTLDVYNVDDIGHTLYNDAVQGKDKVIQVQVSRTVGTVTTSYTLTLNIHLGAPSESRNGNKYQFQLPFTLNDVDDFDFVKEVSDSSSVTAETPTFENVLGDAIYDVDDDATTLDGTATVTDSGTVSYIWTVNGDEVSTDATYTPDTSTAGTQTIVVTATNTLDESTASVSQSVTITVNSLVDAETPVFSSELEDATYTIYTTSDTATALDGTATVTDEGTVTYQWYTVSDGEDTAIENATSATYTPDISSEGETTYKVVATNTNASATGSTTATASMTCTITVIKLKLQA